MPHYCYILFNRLNNKTYNGYTTNPERRLKQHNRILSGGAKYTTRQNLTWEFLAILESTKMDKIRALKLEWNIKFPTRKKPAPKEYYGPKGRLKGLKLVLNSERFIDLDVQVTVHDEYKDYYDSL